MDQTTFVMNDDQRANSSPVHVPAEIPTADPNSSGPFNPGPGNKWGYGLLLNTADVPGMRRAGTGAWAGLCNTHFTDGGLTLYSDYERALYASL